MVVSQRRGRAQPCGAHATWLGLGLGLGVGVGLGLGLGVGLGLGLGLGLGFGLERTDSGGAKGAGHHALKFGRGHLVEREEGEVASGRLRVGGNRGEHLPTLEQQTEGQPLHTLPAE